MKRTREALIGVRGSRCICPARGEKGFSASEIGIERLDPAFDALVPADAKVEKLAEGFLWIEGPTWFQSSVVFSDVAG